MLHLKVTPKGKVPTQVRSREAIDPLLDLPLLLFVAARLLRLALALAALSGAFRLHGIAGCGGLFFWVGGWTKKIKRNLRCVWKILLSFCKT